MDFLKLTEKRYSVRKFDERPVEQEKIDKILYAGHLAPTAKNFQPQKIYVITGEALKRVKKCTACHYDAPLVLLVCYNTDLCWTRPYDNKKSGDIDASIVATHMILEAAELGIGSTWVMSFDPEATKREFELPDNIVPTCFIPMGYPADDSEPSERHTLRRPADDIVAEVKK